MNILLILGYFRTSLYKGSVGGGEISNIDLASKLVEYGNTVTVYTLHSNLDDFSEYNGIKIRKAKKLNSKYSFINEIYGRINYKEMVKNEMRKNKYDVILAGPDTVGLALSSAREYKIEVGCFVRAFENFNESSKISIIKKIKLKFRNIIFGDNSIDNLKKIDFIIANSKYMKDFCYSQGFDKEIQIVYPALELGHNINIVEKKIKNITMIGTKVYKGNFIVEKLANKFTMLNFNIIGCPNELIKKNKPENLNYVGWCDVINFFKNSTDIVIVPSEWNEPFGRVAIEGLACGNITIVSDKGGLPETVSNIQELVVDNNDIEKWEDKIIDILNNQSAYIEMSNIAKKSLSLYSLDKQSLILHKYLNKMKKSI